MKNRPYRAVKIIVIPLVSFLMGALFIKAAEDYKITKQIIESAEKIIGLEFTEAERDSMIDGLNSNLKNYQNIRKTAIPDDVIPAVQFNPIPPGMEFETKQQPLRFSSYKGTQLPENINDLAYYSIGELSELIRTRKITSQRLTEFFLERLKTYGPKLYCIVTLTEDLALKQAKKADMEIASGQYKGPLHGIPYGVKDLLSTRGYKTTWGAEPYQDQLLDYDATVVKKLEEAGAVLTAKLSMGALAWGDVWFGGMTRNPWDTTQGSSGSSAGSAAAVSAGLLPFAIGTETYGSIVSPSTICGVTGLRPTYGRVSRYGAMALSWSMDKIGPICRNAEDCAIVFNAIKGPDGKDITLYDIPFNYRYDTKLSGLRIGYLKSDFDKNYEFKSNDSIALSGLRKLGVKLIPIELPKLPVDDISIILSAEAAAAFDVLTRSGRDDMLKRQIKDAWPNVFRTSRFIPAVEYINANRIREMLILQMADIMKDIDLYIAPSWDGNNLLLTNLTGHPTVVVPTGISRQGNLTSISFTGRLFGEGKIIAAARAFQQATTFHQKHPPLTRK